MYIGRAGKGQDGYFGNPFRLKQDMIRGGTLAGFREYFYRRLVNDAELHIPADTRSAFPVISVQSPVSIQCCWQS